MQRGFLVRGHFTNEADTFISEFYKFSRTLQVHQFDHMGLGVLRKLVDVKPMNIAASFFNKELEFVQFFNHFGSSRYNIDRLL